MARGGGRSGRRAREEKSGPTRKVDYRNLKNPFTPQGVFSQDEVEALHQTALRVLSDLGIKVLEPEARAIFKAAGALVDEDSQMVRVGPEIVEAAIASAPKRIDLRAIDPTRDVRLELGMMQFTTGAGCPHASDRVRGRRPGSLRDFRELVQLIEGFDALPTQTAVVEPQDIPIQFRHYDLKQVQIANSSKVPFVYARGRGQVLEGFEMLAMAHGLSQAEFEAQVHTFTIINSNSPRVLDIPMAQGIMDFARHGQVSIITPFCLMGAMAPITVAGGLVLQHAESMFGITLSQLVRPGAPVMYGNFASSVDMKSGAPAFGTPEHVKATLGSGQLARHLGLPWRTASGSASNMADAQGAHETEMGTWAAVLAGGTYIVHAAGWLEGGLTLGYEKLITDMEMVQTFAELASGAVADEAEMAFAALEDVQPGGHFFATEHTMDRYQTAFYEPLVADWSNFGQWTDNGAKSADVRATAIWQQRLANFTAPKGAAERAGRLDDYIARRKEAGGTPPVA
jgi:trimethylamine--corrinoid protein Co-methyltransferase